jgi:biopolymer transport protein ExbB
VNLLQTLWIQADDLGRAVALILLGMSVLSWVLILWKTWTLRGALTHIRQTLQAVWQSPSWEQAAQRVPPDAHGLSGLVRAAAQPCAAHTDSLQSQGGPQAFYTRALRQALAQAQEQLMYGQVSLATIGATAPFVGLLGTVWGITRALAAMGESQALRLEQVAAPVGEALVMTAVGLVVALPAVVAYNLLGRHIHHIEAELEGAAHDLLQARTQSAPSNGATLKPTPAD